MINILILDDDALDREILRRVIGSLNIVNNIVEAATTEDARRILDERKAKTEDIDLLIADYKMPGMTGVEFISHYIPNTEPPFLATLMVTGHGDENIAVEAFRAGILDYIPKDKVSPDRLAGKISEALKRVNAMEAAFHQRQALENFASVVAHDIRSPISFIYTALEFMENNLDKPDQADLNEYIKHCKENCTYTLKLVSSLLSFAKTGEIIEEKKKVSFRKMAEDVMTHLSAEISANKVKYQL